MLDLLKKSVREVWQISPDQIEPASKIGMTLSNDFIQGIGNLNGDFVIILDVERTFTSEEIPYMQSAEENPVPAAQSDEASEADAVT